MTVVYVAVFIDSKGDYSGCGAVVQGAPEKHIELQDIRGDPEGNYWNRAAVDV